MSTLLSVLLLFSFSQVAAENIVTIYPPSTLIFRGPDFFNTSYVYSQDDSNLACCYLDFSVSGVAKKPPTISALGLSFSLPKSLPGSYFGFYNKYSSNFFMVFPKGLNGRKIKVQHSELYPSYDFQALISSSFEDLSKNSVTEFWQIDPRWADDDYGIDSGKTIGQIGCCLCCVASIINDLLRFTQNLEINPPTLNKWLQDSKGYASKTLVDHNAVCRVVNSWLKKKNVGFRLVYRRNMGVQGSLLRGVGVATTVRKGGHFVRPYNFTVTGQSSVDYAIMDPMNRQEFLKNYDGYSLTNTRSYYLRYASPSELEAPVKSTSAENIEGAGSTPPPFRDYGNSAVFIVDPTGSLSVLAHHEESGTDYAAFEELLEDAFTGQLVHKATVLDITEAPPGRYTVTFKGPPGVYEVVVRLYDYDSSLSESTILVDLTQSLEKTVVLNHTPIVVFSGTINGLKGLPDGTRVDVSKVIVQAKKGEVFYIGDSEFSPPVKCISTLPPLPGEKIRNLKGVWKVQGQNAFLDVESFTVDGFDVRLLKPLFCVPQRAHLASEFYIRTAGKVTSITEENYILDDVLPVNRFAHFSTPDLIMLGDFIEAEGVCRDASMPIVTYLRKTSR